MIFNQSKSVTELKETDMNDKNEKHSVVEIDCGNTSEDEDDNSSQEFTQLRRSSRMRKPPALYGEWANIAHELNEPLTVTEALSSPKKIEWKKAMEKEIESLHTNDAWDLVKLPSGRKAIGCKWVFKRKHDADGYVESYKARLVAQGFNQKYRVDYDETFCPVVRFESVRTLVALAAKHDLTLHQSDVTTAFLNGELKGRNLHEAT